MNLAHNFNNVTVIQTWLFFLCSLLTIFCLNEVKAKELYEPETVKNRDRPRYDPLGIPVASFYFFPKLEISEYYDDNIFASDLDEKNDFITAIRPQLLLKSNWNNHALNFQGSASILQHINHQDENSEDFSFGGDGRIDILRNSRLTGGADYSRNHRERTSPDDIAGLEQTIFHETRAFSFYEHELSLFTFKTGVRFNRKDFDDVRSTTGIINNDDRDREQITGEFRIGYIVSPQYSAFIQGTVNKQEYDNLSDELNLDRSSSGYEISIGSQFYGSEVLFGELYLGFKEQDYDDQRLKTIDDMTGGGSVTWQPSKLTTLNLASSRTIVETTVNTASGIFETKTELVIDHELLRNLLLNLNLSFAQDDFEGIRREDKYLSGGIGAYYLINRYVNFGINYDHVTRDSNTIDADFSRNRVFLNMNIQM